MENKHSLYALEIGEYIIGITIINNSNFDYDPMNIIENISTTFKLHEINHYNIMSPTISSELIITHKSDMFDAISFHKDAMLNINDDIPKYMVLINEDTSDIYNGVLELISCGELDFLGIMVTTDEKFDFEEYVKSVDLKPVYEYMDETLYINKGDN